MMDQALPADLESRLRVAAEPMLEAARVAAREAVRPWYERKAKATARARGRHYAEGLADILSKAVGVPITGERLLRAAHDATVELGEDPAVYRRAVGEVIERDNDGHLDRVTPFIADDAEENEDAADEDEDEDDEPDGCPEDCEGNQYGECTNPCRDGDCHWAHCLNRDDQQHCSGCECRGFVWDECPEEVEHHEHAEGPLGDRWCHECEAFVDR